MFNKLLLLVSFVITSVILAAMYLPIWASIGLIIIYMLSATFVVKYVMKTLYKTVIAAFTAKGEVLINATAEVHALDDSSPPGSSNSENLTPQQAAEDAARKWYSLDVTITPAAGAKTPFSLWEPGELLLVAYDSKDVEPTMESEGKFDDASCVIEEVRVFQHGKFNDDIEGKYAGAQRLKMLIGVQPGARKLKFRYCFKSFGQVNLPA